MTPADLKNALVMLQADANFAVVGQLVEEMIETSRTDLETETSIVRIHRLQGRVDALREMHRYLTAPHTLATPGAE